MVVESSMQMCVSLCESESTPEDKKTACRESLESFWRKMAQVLGESNGGEWTPFAVQHCHALLCRHQSFLGTFVADVISETCQAQNIAAALLAGLHAAKLAL